MALTQVRPYIRKVRGLGPYSSGSGSGSTRGIEKQKSRKKQNIYRKIIHPRYKKRILKIITVAKQNIPSWKLQPIQKETETGKNKRKKHMDTL